MYVRSSCTVVDPPAISTLCICAQYSTWWKGSGSHCCLMSRRQLTYAGPGWQTLPSKQRVSGYTQRRHAISVACKSREMNFCQSRTCVNATIIANLTVCLGIYRLIEKKHKLCGRYLYSELWLNHGFSCKFKLLWSQESKFRWKFLLCVKNYNEYRTLDIWYNFVYYTHSAYFCHFKFRINA